MYKKNKFTCKNLPLLLNDNIKLGQGTYGIVYKSNIEKEYGFKIMSMKNKYKLNNSHPGYLETLIGKRLSILVKYNITPHINIIYDGINCNLNLLKKLNIDNKWKDKIVELNKSKKIYKNVKIIINELADSDLKKYIQTNDLSLNEHINHLFCFCYTLSCIQYFTYNYRHNDIKPNNILIKYVNCNKNEYNKYIIFGKEFYIPCLNISIKLHDFDFSYSDKYPNQKIVTNSNLIKTGRSKEINPLYDLHSYINLLIKDLKFNKKIIDFYKKHIPENTLGKQNTYSFKYRLTGYHRNKQINYIPKTMNTPFELLLLSPYFKEYEKKPKEPYIIKNIYNSHIKKDKSIFLRKDMCNTMLIK